MRKATIDENKRCPVCERIDGQVKNGRNRSGTQTCLCKHCKKTYTLEPKKHAYSEEIRQQAIKTYFSGVSGRGVGKLMGMNKSNVYNWIKKNEA